MKNSIFNAVCKTRYLALLVVLIFTCGNTWGTAVDITPGTNGSSATINSNSGVKVGTSKAGGTMTITVPSGTTSLTFYAAAWNGVTGLSLNISATNGTVSPTSVSLTADAGISGNSPFTLSGSASTYRHTITLSNVTASSTLTFTTSSAKRFVAWGADYTVGSATKTFTLAVPKGDGTYDQTQTGQEKTALTETNATKKATSCTYGLAGYYASVWTSTAINTPTSAYPSPVYTSSTADGSLPASGTTLYPVFTNDAGKYLTNPLCADPTYYTVTYNYGSGTGSPASWTQTSGNLSTTLPTATPSCDGWTFAGWCTSSAGDEDDNTTSPGTILTGSYTPTSDVTLYAVYTKSGGGGGGGSGSETFTFSDIADSKGWENSVAYTSVTIGVITIEAQGGGNNGKWYTSGGGSWRMYSGGTVEITCSTGDITAVTSSPTCSFDIEDGVATFSPSARTDFTEIVVTYSGGGGGTTYYMTNYACSSCAVPTALTNGSINQTSAQVSWTDAANASNGYYVAYSSSSSTTPGDITSSDATYTVQSIASGTKSATLSTLACGTTYHWWVRSNCGGSKSAWVAGTDIETSECTTPTITVSPSSITGLNYIVGQGPSTPQNITLGGSYLSASITITAPDHFEVSTDGGSTYGGSKTVTVSSGSPTVSTVKVRLKANESVGTYGSASTYVTFASTGATTKNVSVQGSVLKPTITASPASITGWTTQTGSAPDTKSVTVTGANLKGVISASLTGTNASDFSISPSEIAKATAEGAGGTITITYTGSYASAATKSATLLLTATDADPVNVSISFEVQDDPREKFTLLTNSNIGQLSDGAKVVLVHAGMFANHAMKNVTGSKGFDAVEEGVTEFEISGTTLYLNDGNNVQVLDVEESGSYFALKAGSAYLQNSADKSLTTTTTTPLPDAAKWAISVDAGDNTAAITSQGTQGQDIRYNTGQALTAQPFRCYASSTSDDIYIYFQPSADPAITVSPTSLTGFGYVVGDGANSEIKEFSVSGINLTGNLTVKAPTNYQVSTDGGSSWSTSGGTKTITASGTLSATTVKVRLVSGLSRGTYNDATGVKVYGGGVLEANAKTVAVSGTVTNPFHTLTMARNGGTAGCTTSPAEGSTTNLEETYGTQVITASPAAGYQFVNWTKTSGTLADASSSSTTFTMGNADATVTANFSQIMVSAITVSGDATVKTLTSKTYTATVTPDGALTKTVTWSVINGTGTATINSSGVLTAGSPGTVTVRATATDGSGVYGELAVTIQDVVRYKFVKMTSTPDPWEDDDYLIVKESSSTSGYILKASDPFGTGEAGTGVGTERAVTISSGSITLEDDMDDAVHISYVDTKGYLIQGGGSHRFYIIQNETETGGNSMKTLASDNTANSRYWSRIAYNLLKYQSTYNIAYNSNSFRFYNNNYTSSVVLYRLETAYTITCNTPSTGTLTSDMGSAASGTTVSLTVTPSSGYELSALTITKDGGGTVTPTKVDETHYTFTMPKDNVTVEATFVTIQTKDIIFHTPSCVSTPSTLSGKATGATVTLPSEPSGTPDGYTFLGWVLAEQVSPVAVQPTTYAPGSYTVPSGAADVNMYALYSEGGISVGSGTFNYIHEASSGLTTFTNLTSDDYYIFTSEGNNAAVVSNTISGTRVGYGSCTGAGESNATISTADGVYLLHKTGDYYTLKNVQTGQYLASTGIKSQATMMDDDGTNDHVKWSIVSTAKGYKLANKYNTDNDVNAYLGFSAGNGYGCYASSNTTITMFFYKAASGAVTINTTYTTSPDCFCEYSLLKSTNSGSTWEEVGCFTKVKPNDDTDHEWRLSNFTMPAHNSSNLIKVQKNGADLSGQTASWQSGWIPLAELQGTGCTYKAFELEGAVGTLRIFDNDGGNSVDANSNFYLGFYPTYQICHKNAAPDVWISEPFELVDAGTHKYETAITTAPASYFADNYQFYVGVRKADGTTKFAEKNSNEATAKSNTVNMKTMGGMTSDVGGRSGVYQIYSNSCDQNWYCQFIPYYVVYYHDVNGNEIEEWRDVLTSPTTTVHAYASGQTGWATSQGGSASATYNAGSVITPAADIHLYQVASTYTVTFSVAEESSSYDGTSVKVIQGQSMTLPTITFSCALYPTFVGWVTGDAIPASDPEVQTEEPATFIGAGGDSYIPTGNVTLRALYGHNCDGNSGWQKQTSIRAGKYIIVAGTYGFAGLESAVSSTTNQGSYLSDVSVVDGTTVSSSTGMHEVDVLLGENGTFAIKYSDGQYMENSGGYFNGNVTNLANAYRWKMNASGQIYDAEATTMFLQINNSNHKFKCYAGTQSTYANLFRYTKTGYYTTDPTCAVPTEFTLSFNGNKPDGWSGDVSGVPSDITRTFSSYPTLATAIDLGSITNPTLTGWLLTGWNTAPNGSGTPYALDAEITEYTGSGMTLYAQWERVYSVKLMDNGVERATLVETSAGAGVTLPSGNNCTPSSTFTFEGWTESAVELNADPVRPATLHAAGAFAPTSDITLYSVYSKSVAGCEDFAAGVSGAYTVQRDSYYAQNTGSDNQFDIATTNANAAVFYIAYSQAKSGYTIRTKDGYIGWNYDGSNITKTATSPYYWNINGSAVNGWKFTPQGVSSKYLSLSTSGKFKMYGTDYGYNTLTKTAMKYYYNTAICEGAQITFHDGGGTISGTPTTPTGASWNSSTHVLSGLEDCDKITEFPTANYDGWTFIGWSTEDYSNSGKHTTDHPEENAGTDEPDGSEIYKTGGNSYVVRGGSVDLYPVFTRFPENEPFNTETGGDYYIYYLKPGTDDGYGANIRVYAGEYDGEKRYSQTTSCAAATTFTFTKSGDVWHIQNVANGKYVGGKSNDDWLVENVGLGTLTDWTITIKSGNQFYASCQGGGRYITFSTSANYFMDYSTTANPGICLPVYLGSCTERIYSSEPNPVPTIDLDGEPYVTSSNGERVRATATMTLSAAHLSSLPANKVIVSGGTGLKFATTASANPTPTVSLSLTEGSLAATTIYVYYTPSATEDGLENIIVTAKAYNGSSYKEFQKTGTVHARHLPADFVIAAKWNDKWYAMPNTCTSSGSSTTGVLITVDNDNDPTCATYAPMTAKWGMRQTKDGSRTDGSYNDRLVFTERGTTATANSQQALYNYNSADIYTNATYANYNNTNPDRYEWIPVTSDFKDYTLTNANDAGRTLILRNSDGEFKAQNTDQAYDGKVRLLPATFKEDNVQILEWKASSVVIMYTGTETTAKTKVGSNAQSSAQTLSGKKIAHGIYELSAPSLTGNAGNTLEISFGSDASKKLFEIPIIITGNSTAATGHDKQDVVIVKNAKLTAATTKYSYRNIYVYGGGKLNIPTGTALGINNIILRAGSISTDGAGGSATYEYIYPQVYLAGTFSSTKTDIKYEYITDYTHWYQLCLPFNASLNSIHYPKEYYGNIVTEGNSGSWVIKRYAGEIRATGEYDAWKDIETESATAVMAGNGYLFWGAPKNVTIGGDKQRQTWGIQRMTMSIGSASAATTAETNNKNITVHSYSEQATSTKPNDQGWNLVGNPFMVNLTAFDSETMIAGKLVQDKDDNDKWTGKWKNDGTAVRYVTVPDEHFNNYVAKTCSLAIAEGDFMPGRAFFVQIAADEEAENDDLTLTFVANNRSPLNMPAWFARNEEKKVDIETGIVMSNETLKDEVNFWIKTGKTAEYDINADYPKTPNSSNFNIYGVHSHGDLSWVAISPEIAAGSMAIGYQVPAAGDFTLSLSESYVSEDIEALYVTDHGINPEVTTNLVEDDYLFTVNQAETNNERFTVSIILKKDEPVDPTALINAEGVDSDKPIKFIHQDKMYILYQGIIYDATGKRVKVVNK